MAEGIIYSKLQYDARVQFTTFNQSPVRKNVYANEYFTLYEGLVSVSTNSDRMNIGSATITIQPPLGENNIPNRNILKRTEIRTAKWKKANDIAEEPLFTTLVSQLTSTGLLQQQAIQIVNDNVQFDPDSDTTPRRIKYVRQELLSDNLSDLYKTINDLSRPDIISGNTNFTPIVDENFMECFFQPMDKIRIWLSDRFQGNSIDEDNINETAFYSTSFVGLINSVSVSYSSGSVIISINCSDLSKWLNISQFNVNPALASNKMPGIFADAGITWTSSNLQTKLINDIVEILVLGIDQEWVTISENDPYYLADVKALERGEVTEEAFKKRYRFLAPQVVEGVSTPKTLQTKVSPSWGPGHFRLLPKNEGMKTQARSLVGEIEIDTGISADTLWIDPALPAFRPYVYTFNNFSLFEHNWRKRLDIIKEIAAVNDYEFYCDVDGKLIFKIPDYNLNPGSIIKDTDYQTADKQSDVYKYKSPTFDDEKEILWNDDKYLIKQKEIISYSNSVSDDNIVTVVFAKGDMEAGLEEIAKSNTNWEYNTNLAKRFGVRIKKREIPLLTGQKNETARGFFAESFLNRNNAMYKTMTITIPMRPELKLARTIAIVPISLDSLFSGDSNQSFAKYVELLDHWTNLYKIGNDQDVKRILENLPVYYISGIQHNYTAGSLCTTTLQLTHGRKWTQDFGKLAFKRSNVKNPNETNANLTESQKRDKETQIQKSVRKHQEKLLNLGFYNGIIDGQVDDELKKSVKTFIARRNLDLSQSGGAIIQYNPLDNSYEQVFPPLVVTQINTQE